MTGDTISIDGGVVLHLIQQKGMRANDRPQPDCPRLGRPGGSGADRRDPAGRQPPRIRRAADRRRHCGGDRSAPFAKAAAAVRIDGRLRDLAALVDRDATVAVITRDSEDRLTILRHDAAHVMAEAVKELYSETEVTFGPATETGFYYDFARAEPFTPEDLERIEARMREIMQSCVTGGRRRPDCQMSCGSAIATARCS
jgi:hypothetical protein